MRPVQVARLVTECTQTCLKGAISRAWAERAQAFGAYHEGLGPETPPYELVKAFRSRYWLPQLRQALPLGKVQGMDLRVANIGRTVGPTGML